MAWLAAAGGTAGLLKMTMPTAFTTATLAWGLLTFPQGYRDAGATAAARAELTWGAKYLLKAVGGVNAPYLVSQVCCRKSNVRSLCCSGQGLAIALDWTVSQAAKESCC